MKSHLFRLLAVASVLTVSLPSLVGVHLSKFDVERLAFSTDVKLEHRIKRQLIMDPQPFNPLIANRVLQVPIPTNIGFFPGAPQTIDQCDRDEIMTEDGTCQRLLSQGNCQTQEEVIMDPQTSQGFCAPRICPPDRVFLPQTQMCHDPRDATVCPPGRELYYSAFGTPVCTCPDGTVEGDDDLDDDVCEVLLSESLQCPPGKIFWFKDFNSPPGCFPDPCNGANLKRGPNELPFVPDMYGKCFQLGTSAPACSYGKLYVLNLEDLRGECASLEDAGYNIFDPQVLNALKKMFGPTITLNNAPPIPVDMLSYGNTTKAVTGAIDPQGNTIDSRIKQGTRRPGSDSSYQSYSNNRGQTTTPTGVQSSINQNQNTVQTSNTIPNQNNRPSTPTHHIVVLGPNGITTTKKKISVQQNSQRPLGVRPTSIPSSQRPTIHQSQKPNNQNTQAFIQQQKTQRPVIQQQNTQRPVIQQQNTQRPFIQQTIPKPSTQQNNFPNLINNNIQTGIQNALSPTNQQGQGKKVCTFVQNPGTPGRKVCTYVQTGLGQANSFETNGQGGGQASFEMFSGRMIPSYGYRLGKSFGFRSPPQAGLLTHHVTVLPTGKVITHLRPATRTKRDVSEQRSLSNVTEPHSRKKRNVLAHASPSNVFETRLLGCRPGAARDINGKCRSKVLPTRIPKRRGTRAAPPVPPTPSCPQGMAFNIRRMCVPATTAQNTLLAFNLG